MSLPRSIHQVRESRARLQDILVREWIAPDRAPNPADLEIWASMVLLHLTEPDADVNEVTGYLFDVATGELGRPANAEVRHLCADMARKLVRMRGQFLEQ